MSSGIIKSSSLTNTLSGAGFDDFISFVNLYVAGTTSDDVAPFLLITFSTW